MVPLEIGRGAKGASEANAGGVVSCSAMKYAGGAIGSFFQER